VTRVFAPAAAPPSVVLTREESHHLARVLRASVGDAVIVFNGKGREWGGRIATASASATVVDLVGTREPLREPGVRVVLGVALLKGDQMDAVVRDATALGVSAIQPLTTAHVALPDEARRARSIERWERVAIAAAKQCGRAVVPAIHPMAPIAAAMSASACEATVMCVEPSTGGEGSVAAVPRVGSALVLVGPEGGWSSDEVAHATAAGARMIALGPRTLRAELAPAVALSALWTVWGWP